MSGSAISSAKKRRANNLLANPLFQSPESQQSSTAPPVPSVREEIMNNRPLTLQQALQLLNGRIVQLERNATNTTIAPTSVPSIDESRVQEIVNNAIELHFAEFDHRYEILASEILN